MLLQCYNSFGNYEPGDELEVPDGALYDAAVFKEVPAPAEDDESAEEGE